MPFERPPRSLAVPFTEGRVFDVGALLGGRNQSSWLSASIASNSDSLPVGE